MPGDERNDLHAEIDEKRSQRVPIATSMQR